MNKTHTAQTLKYYFGQPVYCADKDLTDLMECNTGILEGIWTKHEDSNDEAGITGGIISDAKYVYPILKTAEELTDDDKKETYCAHNQIYDNFQIMTMIELVLMEGIKLINKGFGAIPNEESQTGYVDLLGMPCVTPEQVEEGIEL